MTEIKQTFVCSSRSAILLSNACFSCKYHINNWWRSLSLLQWKSM